MPHELRRLGRPRATAVAVAAFCLARTAGAQVGAADSLADFTAIDAYVEAELRADRVPGAAIVIVHGDQVVHTRGFGQARPGVPVTPKTGFVLGSMSKGFTALAVMQLVEQGRIALDTPVARYLPWFRVADWEAADRITVRHLLYQTSGIPARAPQAPRDSTTISAHVRALARVALHHEPGAIHEYSSPNYLVLGAMIEAVTEDSYATYIQRRVFDPLDMRASYTAEETARDGEVASGYRYWFGYPRPATLPFEADRLPTAALISSADDLGHYLIAQLNGGKYLGQSVLSPAGMDTLHAPGAPSDGFSYAMGWRVSEIGGATAVHHGGIVPNYRGKIVMLPGARWGVAVLTNVSSILPVEPTSHRIADNIAASLAGRPLPPGGSRLTLAYLALSLVMLFVTGLQLWELATLGRWRRRIAIRPARERWIGVGFALLFPFALLYGLPKFLQIPMSEIIRSAPDIGYWMLLSVVLGEVAALIKAGILGGIPSQSPDPDR